MIINGLHIHYLQKGQGKPVLIVARYGPVEDKKYHAMIACDYDENLNDIYVHTGWREESTGKTLSHISLDNFGFSNQIDGRLARIGA